MKKRPRIPYVPKPLVEKKIPVPTKLTEQEIKKIVDELICVEARPEAILILSKSNEGQIKEFMTYYTEKKENICCMVLDSIKMKLVELGEMTMNEDDHFGKPIWD